jgi:hypothetical protein
MGFLTHLYETALQPPYDMAWMLFGYAGAVIFGVRFLIQWITSERHGHSVIPLSFWYASFIGGMISFLYAIHQAAWPLVLQQALPLPIYIRNIWMILRDRRRAAESV